MQNNNPNGQLNENENPNYPYTNGVDSDYNQRNNNQFPQEFYDANAAVNNPNLIPNNPPQNNSWRAFSSNKVENNPNEYHTINNPDSLQTRPESELTNPVKNTESYVYSSPTLVHNNGNTNPVVSSDIAVTTAANSNTITPAKPNEIEKKPEPKEDKNIKPIKTKSGVTGLMIAVLLLISIISIASSSAVAGLVAYYIVRQQNQENQQKSSAIAEITTTRITDEQSGIVEAVSVARESVVSVIISKNLNTTRSRFFDTQTNSSESPKVPMQIGAGTGFIVSSQGYILTNRHVVEDTTAQYTIVLDNDTRLKATVLGRDAYLDIAILKVDPNTNLKPLKLGDSSNIKVGQTVIAIGNSLGQFNNSVSKGVVSGLGRTIMAASDVSKTVETLEGVIQTDASINPGNSGGPLLDINGFAIGVNVAKSDDADNVSFSIPINDVKQLLEIVISTGKIQRPYLGVQYLLLNDELAREQNLSVDYGAYIFSPDNELSIAKDGPADKAGLKDKDIILEINNQKITADNDLRKVVQKSKVGDALTLKVLRDKNEIEIKVKLEELKE
jgi:serine protease Do